MRSSATLRSDPALSARPKRSTSPSAGSAARCIAGRAGRALAGCQGRCGRPTGSAMVVRLRRARRAAWLVPVLAQLLPHMLERLGGAWRALGAHSGAAAAAAAAGGAHTSEGAAAAEAEVVAERLLRELTQEHLLLLKALHTPSARPARGAARAGPGWLRGAAAERVHVQRPYTQSSIFDGRAVAVGARQGTPDVAVPPRAHASARKHTPIHGPRPNDIQA